MMWLWLLARLASYHSSADWLSSSLASGRLLSWSLGIPGLSAGKEIDCSIFARKAAEPTCFVPALDETKYWQAGISCRIKISLPSQLSYYCMVLCNTVTALIASSNKHNAQKGCEFRELSKALDNNLIASATISMEYNASFDKVSVWHFPFCIKSPPRLALRTRLSAGHGWPVQDRICALHPLCILFWKLT